MAMRAESNVRAHRLGLAEGVASMRGDLGMLALRRSAERITSRRDESGAAWHQAGVISPFSALAAASWLMAWWRGMAWHEMAARDVVFMKACGELYGW